MFAGLCFGQHAPLQDPGHGQADQSSDVQLNEAQWHDLDHQGDVVEFHMDDLQPSEVHELHHAHEIHVEAAEESAESEGSETCSCGGEKHCHGVCRDPGHPKKPKHDKPGDVDRGDCPGLRYRISDCKRAGNPRRVARLAKCSVNGKYSSWFVGGGAAFFRGQCRKPTQGTWGMDYDGAFGRVNNWLNYTRGRKQGGEGAYRTDGEPKVVSRAHEILGLGH
jgi:hypothetical protein